MVGGAEAAIRCRSPLKMTEEELLAEIDAINHDKKTIRSKLSSIRKDLSDHESLLIEERLEKRGSFFF